MTGRQWRQIIVALVGGVLLFAACGEQESAIPTPALDLNTPAPASAQVGQGFPSEVIVVLVTPTPSNGGDGATQDGAEQESVPAEGNGAEGEATPSGGEGGEEEAASSEGEGGEGGGEGEATPEAGDGEGEGNGAGGGEMSEEELISTGEQIYSAECATCHQDDGQGTDTYPALSGSEVATAEDPAEAIQTVIQGRGEMPSFGEQLADEEIAAVLSYVRNSWDNSASVVMVEEVSQAQDGEQQDAQQQDGEEQAGEATPTPEAGDQQDSQQQEGEATPTPEGDGGQAQQPAPQQVQIQIQIEVVVVTPTGEVESAGEEEPAQNGEDQTTPTPEAEDGAEEEATPAAEDGAEEEATPTPQEGGAEEEAAPTPEGDAEGEATEEEATPTPEGEGDEEEATPTAENGEGAAQIGEEELINTGERVYASNCAACHQLSGEGSNIYPPLSGNDFVTAEDPSQAIQTVIQGRGEMPSFGEQLADEEIAAVLSYVRNSWENEASVVTVDEVSQAQNGQQQEGEQQDGQQQAAQQEGEDQAAQAGEQQAAPQGQETGEAAATVQVGDITIQIEVVTPTPPGGTGEATPSAEETPSPEGETEEDSEGDALPEGTPTGEPQVPEGGSGAGQEEEETEDDATAEPGDEELVNSGAGLFAQYCAACHQEAGQGVDGVYPPLASNPFVTAEDPSAVIDVVLTGRAGMPHFGAYLETEQVAAILAYIRNAWGNQAPAPTVDQVNQIAETVTFEEDEH